MARVVIVAAHGRRSAAAAIVRGLRATVAVPGVVLVLWGWSLLLALAATAPLASWWFTTLPHLPAADARGEGLPLRLLAELVGYDRTPVGWIVVGVVTGVALVAIVGHSFLIGGAIAALARAHRVRFAIRDDDPLTSTPHHPLLPGVGHSPAQAFGHDAARFFARNIRLLLVHLVLAGASVVTLAALGFAATSPWRASVQPLPAFLSLALPAALVLLGIAFFSMVLDYARIRLVTGDGRSVVAAWFGAVAFVVRRFAGALGIWITLTLAVLAATVLVALSGGLLPATTWPGLAALVVTQQALMVVRAGLRVARLSAAIDYSEPG
jgi:hypothetical protein